MIIYYAYYHFRWKLRVLFVEYYDWSGKLDPNYERLRNNFLPDLGSLAVTEK